MEKPPSKGQKSHLKLVAGALVLIIGSAVIVGFLIHLQAKDVREQASRLQRSSEEGRAVVVAEVKPSPPEKDLLLIGETRSYYSVTIFARVSGYLRKLLADIGDDIKEGQLLAYIESPETEQAYNSAKADSINRRRIADRYRVLLKRKLVSPQEAQQAFTAADIADAVLKTQEVLRSYQNLQAPFAGKITQRFVDPGALIQNASGSQSASQPLFTLSQTNRLRIFIYIDQKDAPYVRVGDPVQAFLPSRADQKFSAKIEMLAGELDPKTRTLLGEIIMDNSEQKITAGSFVQVEMKIKREPLLTLPVQALVMRGPTAFVPLIGDGNRVHYVRIDLADNDGKNILIRSGVREGDRVVVDAGNSLVDGQKVKPVEKEKMVAGTAGDL